MNLKITQGVMGERPPVTLPHPAFYDQLQEERFKNLVYSHYELIRESDIAFLFPVFDEDDFNEAKDHAFSFLIEICGGPKYFTQTRGEYQMVGRHAPFRIDENARVVWLRLYKSLLEELEGVEEVYIQSFWEYLNRFSMWMVNTKS